MLGCAILAVISLLLLYQGVAFSFNIVPRLLLKKLDSNILFYVVGTETSKFALILGILGLVACVFYLVVQSKYKDVDSKKVQIKSLLPVAICYVFVAIMTLF